MLFVYGTLRDQDVLALVLGRMVEVAALPRANAPGFRAVAFPGRVYPALVAAEGDAAPGLAIAGLDGADLARLDAFEGDEYRRGTVTILVGGQTVEAEAYFPTQDILSQGAPWSLAQWTRLHKAESLADQAENAAALRRRLSATRTDPGSHSRG